MKKSMVIGLALGAFALTATSAFAGTIVNSKHDLSATGPSPLVGTGDTRICVYCHHPHNTAKAGTVVNGKTLSYSPLWNRGMAAADNFTTYNNGTNMGHDVQYGDVTDGRHVMNGKPAIGGVTLLCLSCHDGSTAVGAYSTNNPDFDNNGTRAGATGKLLVANPFGASGTGLPIDSQAAFGSGGVVNLSNHHPVGMSWDEVVAGDPEIAAKTDTFKNTTITISSVLTGGDTMECNACHDVHNTQAKMGQSFIWTDNAGSNFCLSCHIK